MNNTIEVFNPECGIYQMSEVFSNLLPQIGYTYKQFEKDTISNCGYPVEDILFDPNNEYINSTREVKLELLNVILQELNKYSNYQDKIIIK